MLGCARGDGNDSGAAGGAFILLGDDASSRSLAPVDDATIVDRYAGSEEAAVGNGTSTGSRT